jgi:hypothetical protein
MEQQKMEVLSMILRTTRAMILLTTPIRRATKPARATRSPRVAAEEDAVAAEEARRRVQRSRSQLVADVVAAEDVAGVEVVGAALVPLRRLYPPPLTSILSTVAL